MPIRTHHVEMHFSTPGLSPLVGGFVAYATRDRTLRGFRVGTCGREDRVIRMALAEGPWFVRVLATFRDGTEEDWLGVIVRDVFVDPRRKAPPAAGNATVACPVAPGGRGLVIFDPIAGNRIPSMVQVIQSPAGEPGTGKLIHVHRVHAGDVLDFRGRMALPFDLPGSSIPNNSGADPLGSRLLMLRAVSDGGRPADSWVEVTSPVPERPGFQGVTIAEVDAAAGTASGFPAVTSAHPYTLETGYGYVLSQVPSPDDAAGWAAKDWGNADTGGILGDQPFSTPFVQVATIETDEIDLGAVKLFGLDIFDALQRKDPEGMWADLSVDQLNDLPSDPAVNFEHSDWADQEMASGPGSLAVHVSADDGSPLHPLRHCYWEVRVSSVVDMEGEAVPYVPYVPGQMFSGRYVQARLYVREETGYFQVMTGDVRIDVLYPKRTRHGTAVFPASQTTALSVTLPRCPVTGGPYFPNSLVVVMVPRDAVPHHAQPQGVTAGTNSFTLKVWAADGTSNPPGDDIDVDWIATGY